MSVIKVNDQLYLSELLSSDEAVVVEYLQEREIYERTLRIPWPYGPAEFREWLKIVARLTAEQGGLTQWAIRKHDGTLIGACGFENIHVGKSHRGEIGYWLAKPYWGQGIMTAVVKRLCEYAFAEFGLSKIVAHVYANNPASATVLEKCGFVQEGYLRKHYLKDGVLYDAKLYGLIKE